MGSDQKLGVVLGAGVAKGWAHIGVLQALNELGIKPDIVCGCSAGALVGASYATGHLDSLDKLARSLTKARVIRYFDISFAGGGLIEGRWIADFFERNLEDIAIENTSPTFGTVATELHSSRETWLTSGSIIVAVRASIAIPGLFTPIKISGQWLIDGALVNPLPVSLCRALGASMIIGVSLSGDFNSQRKRVAKSEALQLDEKTQRSTWLKWLSHGLPLGLGKENAGKNENSETLDHDRPSYLEVIGEAFFIVTDFVARIRLAADPVDLLISPNVEHIGLMDFHRANETIEAGRNAVMAVEEDIRQMGNRVF